jgi:hypothetical protein
MLSSTVVFNKSLLHERQIYLRIKNACIVTTQLSVAEEQTTPLAYDLWGQLLYLQTSVQRETSQSLWDVAPPCQVHPFQEWLRVDGCKGEKPEWSGGRGSCGGVCLAEDVCHRPSPSSLASGVDV